MECKFCGSTSLKKHGWKILSGGHRKQQYQCKECGRIFYEKEQKN